MADFFTRFLRQQQRKHGLKPKFQPISLAETVRAMSNARETASPTLIPTRRDYICGWCRVKPCTCPPFH